MKLLSDRLQESHQGTQAAIVSLSRLVETIRDGAVRSDPETAAKSNTADHSFDHIFGDAGGGAVRSDTETPAESNTPRAMSVDMGGTGTGDKWLQLGAWAARTAVTIAAPEIAIPGSAALTAAGLALSWLRRKRQARQPGVLGSRSNPITVHEPAAVQTETKYVVTESDVLGEAYREAARRVANTYREKNPAIVDVLKQLDGAATQIAHGARVQRRQPAASETLP